MKYHSIGVFANKIGKTIQTLRNWTYVKNPFLCLLNYIKLKNIMKYHCLEMPIIAK
ncbi:hypothetical protein QEW_4665 [Clostridioides difficile CD160]|nr:hypothetical protein QEW_4665 [Clostridioides difficile CD160]